MSLGESLQLNSLPTLGKVKVTDLPFPGGTHIGWTTRRWSVVTGVPPSSRCTAGQSTEARPVCEDSLIFEDDLPLPLSDMASLEPRGVA